MAQFINIPRHQTRFYQPTKSKSKFWTPDCNVCVFHGSLTGQRAQVGKVSSHVNGQIKSETRMRPAGGKKGEK